MKNKPESHIAALIKKNSAKIINEYADKKTLLSESEKMPEIKTEKVRQKKGLSTKKPILRL